MTQSYHARFRLEASVSENPIIEPFLKGSAEVEILCPKCGPNRRKIKKNGPDRNHREKPELFYCNRHHCSFYVHTSWIFLQLSSVLLERIVYDLFEERLTPKAVVTVHKVSPSLISMIRHHFREALEQKLAILAKRRKRLQQETQLPVPLEWAVWWDETFFTLGNTSWCLILLVNARGEPLGWKFSRTRKTEDYLALIYAVRDKLPSLIIFVGNAWTAYQKTCEKLKEECFLIEHVHSHPWDKVRLHHFCPTENKDTIHQTSLEMPYRSFVTNQPVEGRAYTRTHKSYDLNVPKRRCGRPKGSKDHQKRRPRHALKPKARKSLKQRRGRKSLMKHGRRFCFHPHPVSVGWNIQWLSPPLKESSLQNSSVEELELLLDITYKLMGGGVIQSNRIEGVNREIKAIISDRGLKSPAQVNGIIDDHLRYWGIIFLQLILKRQLILQLPLPLLLLVFLSFFVLFESLLRSCQVFFSEVLSQDLKNNLKL